MPIPRLKPDRPSEYLQHEPEGSGHGLRPHRRPDRLDDAVQRRSQVLLALSSPRAHEVHLLLARKSQESRGPVQEDPAPLLRSVHGGGVAGAERGSDAQDRRGHKLARGRLDVLHQLASEAARVRKVDERSKVRRRQGRRRRRHRHDDDNNHVVG